MKAVAHDVRPHTTSGTELGNFFEQVIVAVEEEGESTGKGVYIETGIQGGLYVADGIRKRECHFLNCRRACLAHMIATDADWIPARQMLGTETEHIGNDAHRMPWRIDIRATRNVFFQHVVLHSAGELAYAGTLVFRNGDIQRKQDAGGTIVCDRKALTFQGPNIWNGVTFFQAGNRRAHFDYL